jgi:nucleolar pre-ribosomal-associated protein 1
LESRLSSKWLANIAFFGAVVSLPIPTGCFLSNNSDLYQPTPPSTSTILENVFPSVNLKNHLSKGLQSSSPLVQHSAAIALAKCLGKYEEILQSFGKIAKSLEEDVEGQWTRRVRDIEKEARRRVPDFQVVVAFAQQKLGDVSALQSGKTPLDSRLYNPQKSALLSECALRLLWLYHGCLPLLVSEARFDVGKLLSSFLNTPKTTTIQVEEGQDVRGLHTLRQLHILRLLKESDQFIWSGRIGNDISLVLSGSDVEVCPRFFTK